MQITIEDLKEKGLLLFESISGSRAYGLNTPTSDTDIRGVFVLPEAAFFGLHYVEQISNESQDIVYYELKRFVELLAKNNPNMLELLNMPDDCILYQHPLYSHFRQEDFLSRQCKDAFAGYALTQVRKARGLNKKIVNPIEPQRKSVLDFCYAVQGQGAVPVEVFLEEKGLKQEWIGLAKIPHMHELYGMYYSPAESFKGIVQREGANDISLSSIPKGLAPLGLMSFNKSAYSAYCKEYKEYWEWVEKRNDARYQTTLSHGKKYDSKNMMHTFRLLDMAEEIAREGKIRVRRPNRDYLLRIKKGDFEYEELLLQAEERIAAMDALYAQSSLPEAPDMERVNKVLIEVRKKFYSSL
ncbi:DNA polymerase beta superfamily protein [Cesiribacter sp. SM1]|uniref:nucleotidyltransferase domain-containing protein n=1 Tax=Cesiribacter sp. SM1 TaxID=2861196 RepID=UPI001CD69599|nr:nucleotidyltransferase domain-containing protein [Cesiribacter sp. SM1]